MRRNDSPVKVRVVEDLIGDGVDGWSRELFTERRHRSPRLDAGPSLVQADVVAERGDGHLRSRFGAGFYL